MPLLMLAEIDPWAVIMTIVGLGGLIFFHELGHFLACRLTGTRVEAFSIGFGKEIVGWQRGPTRYRVGIVPLGGYVKMAAENPGEVNTGEFDPFVPLVEKAKAAGAWVHVDGAFGLWARVSSSKRHLTEGIEGADSWTSDGHKWLNTPYDGAFGICREPEHLAAAMNSDAAYAAASADSQKNLGIEFSRRARGVAIWAALRTLGRNGIEELVDRHCRQAGMIADGLRAAGVEVLNRVVLNQVLGRLEDDAATDRFREAAIDSGRIWFGPSVCQGRSAFRISVSSWRTTDADVENAVALLAGLRNT